MFAVESRWRSMWEFAVEFSQLFCAFENSLNKIFGEEKRKNSSLKTVPNAQAPRQLFFFPNGVSWKILVDKSTHASSPALRQLRFRPHKAHDLPTAPRLERPQSLASGTPQSPTSPGWKGRDHISSLILNTTVEVIWWHLSPPQPDHSSSIPTTQNPSWLITELLKETDGGGTRGEGSGERHDDCPHFTPPELSQQPSLRLNYSCKVEIKPPRTGSFSESESVSHLMRRRTKWSMRIWSRPDPTGFHWDPPDVRLATDWVTVILHCHLSFFFLFPKKGLPYI